MRHGPVCTLEIDLDDTAYPLRATLHYRVYDGFDVLERWATLRHRSDLIAGPIPPHRGTDPFDAAGTSLRNAGHITI